MKKLLLAGVAALFLATGAAHSDEQAALDAKIRAWCTMLAKTQVNAQTERVVSGAMTTAIRSCIGGAQLRFAVDPAAAAWFRNTPLLSLGAGDLEENALIELGRRRLAE